MRCMSAPGFGKTLIPRILERLGSRNVCGTSVCRCSCQTTLTNMACLPCAWDAQQMDDLPPPENAHTGRLALHTMHDARHASFTNGESPRKAGGERGEILAGRASLQRLPAQKSSADRPLVARMSLWRGAATAQFAVFSATQGRTKRLQMPGSLFTRRPHKSKCPPKRLEGIWNRRSGDRDRSVAFRRTSGRDASCQRPGQARPDHRAAAAASPEAAPRRRRSSDRRQRPCVLCRHCRQRGRYRSKSD